MLYLTLDGIEFSTSEYSDLDEAELTIRREGDDGELVRGFSEEIEFYGSAYQYVYDKLINPNGDLGGGYNRIISVLIYNDCCQDDNGDDVLVYRGLIMADSLDWCLTECSLTASIVEDCIDVRSQTCLKSTRVYDNSFKYPNGKGFQQQEHPFIRYCTELRPSFLQDLFMAIGLIINTIIVPALTIVAIIITFINTIIAVINVLPGVDIDYIGNGDINFFDDVVIILDKINDSIVGCKYGHVAPFARDYIQNVCNVCGLQFVSSILNDASSPYYNAMYMNAPVHKGTEDYVTWVDDNKPLETGESMLQKLSKAFNGDFRVQNGTLYFERKDFFRDNDYWLDISAGNDDPRLIKYCLKYTEGGRPAYARFTYDMDFIDWAGNEARSFYNDIVDWDDPLGGEDYGNECLNQSGEALYNIPFAPARFRKDGIDRDVISDWVFVCYFFLPLSLPLLFNLQKDEFQHAMLLPQSQTGSPKLLIWDGESSLKEAKVKRMIYNPSNWNNTPALSLVGGPNDVAQGGKSNLYLFGYDDLYYNWDMWVSAPVSSEIRQIVYGDTPVNKPFIAPNLYDRFFYIDDPRLTKKAAFDFEAEIKFDCDLLETVDFTKGVLLPNNLVGKLEEVSFTSKTIKISGKV